MVNISKFDRELFNALKEKVHSAPTGRSGCDDFEGEVEKAFGFSHFPDRLRSHIHYMAYEHGHSAGYHEVLNEYFDILEIINITLEVV